MHVAIVRSARSRPCLRSRGRAPAARLTGRGEGRGGFVIDARRFTAILLGITAAAVAAGLALMLAGAGAAAAATWGAATLLVLAPTVFAAVRDLLRRRAGIDVIAILAMAGSLALGEYLAGAVIALMLGSGRALEGYAAARAERELSALLARAPRAAHRFDGDALVDVPIEQVAAGDRLLVKESDAVPVDGVIASAAAMLDESALTGESRLLEREQGDHVASGAVNAGPPFEMRATASAEASTYAGIIRLVRAAQARQAPFVRMADRYAALFVPIALAAAGGAWIASGDPVRALAVLVVATPCPLLLAAPIAIVSGISRAAHRGIIVRDGGALEMLARARAVLLDKTGTLTTGTPRLDEVVTVAGGPDAETVLALAASLDQVSSHVLAAAIVRAARDRGLTLVFPAEPRETAGGGMEGLVGERRVRLGSLAWVAQQQPGAGVELARRLAQHGGSHVVVAIDGAVAGALLLDDSLRPDTQRAIRHLRQRGIEQVTMLTGDRAEAAQAVGAVLGVDRILAEQSPQSKVLAVAAARDAGWVTVMVGDGINDAAALATADVGVAMGARGATASSEAADVVIVVDRLDRVVEAIEIAQRTARIARESVLLGMGLSFVAMGFAAGGLLPPVAGAVLQEGVDAAAILWALRALGGGRGARGGRRRAAVDPARLHDLRHEHRALDRSVERLGAVAARLDELDAAGARGELEEVGAILRDVLIPHERTDEAEVYPALALSLDGDDPLAALSRTHHELFMLAHRYEMLLRQVPAAGPARDERREFVRLLYGLHAVLRLHFAQEEELYHALTDE